MFERMRVPASCPLAFTEAPLTSRIDRERVVELVFESLGRPGCFLADAAACSLMGGRIHKEMTGACNGLVVLSGAGLSYTVPVYEGHAIQNAINVLPFAGDDITNRLAELLAEKEVVLHTTLDRDACRDLKERLAYCVLEYEAAAIGTVVQKEYTFSDGKHVQLGRELFTVVETLFQPSLGAIKATAQKGIHELALDSLRALGTETASEMMKCVFTAGGTTRFPGFKSRLEAEMVKDPLCAQRKLRLYEARTEPNLPWRGLSIMAKNESFGEIMITREEYDETGAAIVRKCF